MLGRLGLGVDHRNQVVHVPKGLGQTSGHRWRATERLMDANIVVEHGVEADYSIVRLGLFAERVRQPCEATHARSLRARI